jgi:hypothetical protein
MAGSAAAHGAPEPQHGGVVETANDLSFELVTSSEGAVIHVLDHDAPYATDGMSGKLTVLTGAEKSEADVVAAGENRLEAKGVQIASGAKVVAALTTADQKTITLRFIAK